MTQSALSTKQSCDQQSDLQTVLAAWNEATVRLEQTHNALRSEVQRLTRELEVKNRQLARKNRLADLGQIASHVAHEVRNSLVSVTLYLSLLRRRLDDDPGSVDVVEKIRGDLTSLDATVKDLLSFSADHDPRLEVVYLRQVVAEVYEALDPQLEAQGIQTTIDIPADLTVSADADMVRRAVMNLTLNSLDAMPDGGELVATACRTPQGVELELADSGPGLPSETIGRVFEPFYSTKAGGTGLGLAIVERVATAHGGCVSALNCPEGGAAFTLCFPRQVREAAA